MAAAGLLVLGLSTVLGSAAPPPAAAASPSAVALGTFFAGDGTGLSTISPSGSTTPLVTLGVKATAVATAATGQVAWVAGLKGTDGELVEVTVATGKVLATTTLGATTGPDAVAVGPVPAPGTGTVVFVAERGATRVIAFMPTLASSKKVTTVKSPVALSTVSGSTGLAVAEDPGSTSAVVVLTSNYATFHKVGYEFAVTGPTALAISGTSASYFVASSATSTVRCESFAGGTVHACPAFPTPVTLTGVPQAMSLTVHEHHLVTADANGNVTVIDLNAGDAVHTVTVGGSAGAVALSPGGSTAAVAVAGSGTVKLLTLTGATPAVTATARHRQPRHPSCGTPTRQRTTPATTRSPSRSPTPWARGAAPRSPTASRSWSTAGRTPRSPRRSASPTPHGTPSPT